MNGLAMGLLAVIAGAMMQGSFALPQKFVRNWPWEKSWLFYSISGMVLFPWLLVALVVPNPAQAYANAGPGVLALTAIFGAGWGIGSVLFGLGIAALGVALGFAIIISLTAALGALVPMAVLEPAKFWGKPGALLVIGLVVVIAGVALCAKAGALKDADAAAGGKRKFARGLAICIASGIASPMLNFAFNFGAPIQKEAARLGASMNNASIAVFAVAISAGFLINAGYCLYLLGRNKTWGTGLPADRGRNLLYTLAMGCLWLFGFYFYGVGSTQLGDLGKVIGWPIFMTVMVVVANIWGLLTGEWKNADRRAFRYLGAGLALMVCALAIMAPALKS
ncbi:MAG: L-rhamnose/proton symporter RhaT [Bryobacteraceae bacterium]